MAPARYPHQKIHFHRQSRSQIPTTGPASGTRSQQQNDPSSPRSRFRSRSPPPATNDGRQRKNKRSKKEFLYGEYPDPVYSEFALNDASAFDTPDERCGEPTSLLRILPHAKDAYSGEEERESASKMLRRHIVQTRGAGLTELEFAAEWRKQVDAALENRRLIEEGKELGIRMRYILELESRCLVCGGLGFRICLPDEGVRALKGERFVHVGDGKWKERGEHEVETNEEDEEGEGEGEGEGEWEDKICECGLYVG